MSNTEGGTSGPQVDQAAVQVIDTPAAAAAVLNPMRLRVLAELDQPGSATTVAQALQLPRQKVNYHVRELEKQGFVEEVGTRRRRNCTERLVRRVARSYVIDPAALGPLQAQPSRVVDRFSSGYLLESSARTIRDVAALRRGAERAGKRLATFTLESEVSFPSPRHQAAFLDELADATAALVKKYHRPGSSAGRTYRVTLAGHPAVPDAHHDQ